MTRKELIERLMSRDNLSALDVLPTKKQLNNMTDSALAELLSLVDVVKNAKYRADQLIPKIF